MAFYIWWTYGIYWIPDNLVLPSFDACMHTYLLAYYAGRLYGFLHMGHMEYKGWLYTYGGHMGFLTIWYFLALMLSYILTHLLTIGNGFMALCTWWTYEIYGMTLYILCTYGIYGIPD